MKLAAFVFGAIPLIIQHYAKKYMEDDFAQTLTELEKDFGFPRIKTYDFIIVGGGTAGCVVAGRLSEKFNVLLLESGGSPTPSSHVSIFTRDVAIDPMTNYFYDSLPQRNLSLSSGGIVTLETGKMLGGSGSHNEMVHQRGSPKDWDNYADILFDPSWRYENVLELWKKSEDFIGTLLQPEQSGYYGQGGPLTVDTALPLFFTKWADAGRELGFPVADPNAQQIPSFAPIHKLIDNGGRVSTYNRYVLPYEGVRSNLTVIRYASVTQILLDSSNRAYGVAYLRHGIPQIAHASNEVILSAGSFNSPLILMMSGIGPVDNLEAAGIPVKVASPAVGQNMNDHIWVFIPNFTFNDSIIPYQERIREDEFESAVTDYLTNGVGEFGELQEGLQAFFASSRAISEGEGDWADGRIWGDVSCPMPMEDNVLGRGCFAAELQRPKSKGTLTLNATAYLEGSTDFTKLANIDFNSFSVPSDLDILVEGIELIMNLVENTNVFKSVGAQYVGTAIEGCQGVPFKSREYWACYAQHRGGSAIHMVGTCRMGLSIDDSVTDSKMRVHGVRGLRVVDGSVLPQTPNANLNGPVILVAEKASQDISNEWSS